MVGLVVIVIIVAIAMLFYVSYASSDKREKKNYEKEYSETELGTNFVATLLRTSVCNEEVKDLIIDCAKGGQRLLYCAGGEDSCSVLNDTIQIILNDTLNKWNYAYYLYVDFSVLDEEDEPWEYSGYNCSPETTGTRPVNPFKTKIHPTNDLTEIGLGICGTV